LSAINLGEVLQTLPEFDRSLQVSMQRTDAMRDEYNILRREPIVVARGRAPWRSPINRKDLA
jgi:hypothetical protein